MLAIRLQRTGRSGHTQFRMIVQDSRFSPKRGRVVAYLGSYDPHSKTASIDSEQAAKYLQNGAQPSDSAARLLKKEGVKLPGWVKLEDQKQRSVRNPEKRRSTAPAAPEVPAETAAETPADTSAEEPAQEPATETPSDAPEETPAQTSDEPAAEPEAEVPASEAETPAE